jgi:hypothetical protein
MSSYYQPPQFFEHVPPVEQNIGELAPTAQAFAFAPLQEDIELTPLEPHSGIGIKALQEATEPIIRQIDLKTSIALTIDDCEEAEDSTALEDSYLNVVDISVYEYGDELYCEVNVDNFNPNNGLPVPQVVFFDAPTSDEGYESYRFRGDSVGVYADPVHDGEHVIRYRLTLHNATFSTTQVQG